METYPGTDLLVRTCYGCGRTLETLDDVYVDVDESVCVCSICKERAEEAYDDTQIVPATSLYSGDVPS